MISVQSFENISNVQNDSKCKNDQKQLESFFSYYIQKLIQDRVQLNHVNTDTEGAVERVLINWVSVLSGLNLKKVLGLPFPTDKAKWPKRGLSGKYG